MKKAIPIKSHEKRLSCKKLQAVCRTFFPMILTGILMTSLSAEVAFSQENRTEREGRMATMIDRNGIVLDEHEGAQSVHPQDSLALVEFYHSMKGETWLDDAGWLEDMVVFWNGIDEISEIEVEEGVFEWRVTSFDDFDSPHNMTECGFLPAALGDLTYLDQFQLRREMICGELPIELLELEHLDRVNVRRNFLSGEVPWVAVGNSNLSSFDIVRNSFVGPVMTADIANNPNMGISLSYNPELSGPLPPELGQMRFSSFTLEGMPNIEGPIPDLSENEELSRLQLNWANFDPGPWPEWLQDFTGEEGLDRLGLAGVGIQGEVPDWVEDFTAMTEMYVGGEFMGMDMADFPNISLQPSQRRFRIWGGNFHGELPEWFRDVENLDRLWIAHTNISGDLPGFLGELTSMSLVKIKHNQFTGGIPPQFQLLTNMSEFDLSHNNLEIGDIPDLIGENMTGLSKLYLAGSGVTGEIPESLAGLEGLTFIRLQDNPELGGTIPEWIWNDNNLEALDLSYTGIDLNGEFPIQLQDQQNLKKLGLAGLGISGPIPPWLGDIPFYRTDGTRDQYPFLALQDNNLTGEIPENFAKLGMLDSLNLANNQLEGSIDMLQYVGHVTGRIDDGTVSQLNVLDVSGNSGLTGEIPSHFANGSMRVFKFDDTDLCMPDQNFADWLAAAHERAGYAWANRTWPHSDATDPESARFCSDVSAVVPETPDRFYLHQSYPNPFNPTSTIRYELAEDMNVSLTVYNLLGQRIAVLVNEPKTAGVHQVQFHAENLASGQYIYRLEAGDRVMTQTMTLVK